MEPLKKVIIELGELISKKYEELKGLENKVKALEQKNDAHEQYSRRNNLRLHGIQETPDENLEEVVVTLMNKELQLDPPLASADIDRLHRIGPRNPDQSQRPRQVILKLTSYRTRERIYKSRAKLRHSACQVYVNEDLTKPRASLLWAARQEKKKGKIQDVWSYDGKVSIKLLNGRITAINDREHLGTLVN